MFDAKTPVLTHRYADLGKPFVYPVPATPLRQAPQLLHLNDSLSQALGFSDTALKSVECINQLTGNTPWPGYSSVASIYCGHQFGVFVPQLGDGRALMIAEFDTPAGYRQFQLKGAGPTPFSRQGDGRAVLRSSIREYLASEAMHHLGIPTTRALSLTATADPVFRETTETAAVVCRVSPSFLRFGHVEYFTYSNQLDALKTLLQWHIQNQHPELMAQHTNAAFEETLFEWLAWVIKATAELMAHWQSVGFCHGVMNTDNMSLLGLTIDYGPYGFIDQFDIDHICNHSDHQGRYSYRNQPQIGHWNLYALAQALSPLLPQGKDTLQTLLDTYVDHFQQAHQRMFCSKLGLNPSKANGFEEDTLKFMHEQQLDFTRFFRSLSAINPEQDFDSNWAAWQHSPFFALKLGQAEQLEAGKQWLQQWLNLQPNTQGLDDINPAFVLRNHLLQNSIDQAQRGEFSGVNALYKALCNPFTVLQDQADFYSEPPDWARSLVLSCSS